MLVKIIVFNLRIKVFLFSAQIFPDAACHRKILDLTVKCPHLGCSWTGELRAVEVYIDFFCICFPEIPSFHRNKLDEQLT